MWKKRCEAEVTCRVIKISQLRVPNSHITSMALTHFTPWTDQARQLWLHCVIRVSMVALEQIQCLCSVQSRNLWDYAVHSETAHQSGHSVIFSCNLEIAWSQSANFWPQPCHCPMWKVFIGIRGVTRILRLRKIVGKSVQCPRSRPVRSNFQLIQQQDLEQCRHCWSIWVCEVWKLQQSATCGLILISQKHWEWDRWVELWPTYEL